MAKRIRKKADVLIYRKVNRLKKIKQTIDVLKKDGDKVASEVKKFMGEYTELIYEDRLIATYKYDIAPTKKVDEEKLERMFPEIYKQVLIKIPPKRKFNLK